MSRATRRTPGRRTLTERPPTRGRPTFLAVLVVALTAAVLTLAGTTHHSIGSSAQTYKRVDLQQRTFSCGGGIGGATAVQGDIGARLPDPTSVAEQPRQFDVDHAAALESFAAQESRSKDWFAWSPCPEPRPSWWFVGAGAATVTHDTVLTLSNPRAGQADLDINVYGPKGPVAAPGLHGITVPAGSTKVIDLAKVAPAVGDLAVNVVATRGLVAISAADRFAPGVIGKPVQEWLPGQVGPSRLITLAGLPPKPDQASLLVVNPRPTAAIVSVHAIGGTGTFAPKDNASITVAPESVVSVPVRSVFDGGPMALRLTSQQPVTATVRTLAGGDVAFAGAVRPIRDTTAIAVPHGDARLVLSSTGENGTVDVTAFDRSGKQVLHSAVAVAKETSVATALPASTAYLQLVSASPEVIAGLSVSDPAGIATAGVMPSIRSVLMPVVRPGW
ncbi:MAG TPA: DUF5719 family protein [Marmoricola sp.]|nr:DUF5719 family protein [Marmoricola sp.]